MPWRETPGQLARARAERPVRVAGPDGELFGVLTPPAPEAPPRGLCSIHLTRPRSHRNRNWVEIARALAGLGATAFRFDYHGTGDSGGASAFLDPNRPHLGDVTAVIRHLREHHGQRRFVLTGSCFDGRTALSAFADEADAIEALLFIAAPVTSLEHLQALKDSGKDLGHLWRALRNPENWRRLREPGRWRHMTGVLQRMTRPGGEPAGPPAVEPTAPRLHPVFVAHFEALARSRARALFLYGEQDAEFLTFQLALRDLWPRLAAEAAGRLEVEVWPGEVHGGFMQMDRQREIVARSLEWLGAVVENTREPGSPAASDPARWPARHRPEGAWTSP